MYKDNENAFIYLDPPYLDSYNASYSKYQDKHTEEENNIIDHAKYILIYQNIKKIQV